MRIFTPENDYCLQCNVHLYNSNLRSDFDMVFCKICYEEEKEFLPKNGRLDRPIYGKA